jgi:transcriptional regulator with XRE-family HTH domain
VNLDLEDIPLKLRRVRERAGMGQLELARTAKLTQGQISHYESGRALPGLESLARICAALGVTVADFLGEKEPHTAPPREPSKEEMTVFLLSAIGISEIRIAQIERILGVKQDGF